MVSAGVDVIAAAVDRIPEPSKVIAPLNSAEQFDPSIHEAGPTGNGLHNIDGSLKKKRGRRSNPKATESRSLGQSDSTEVESAEEFAATVATATIAIQLITGAAAAAIGPDWAAEDHERAQMVDLTAAWMTTNGITDLPPNLAFVLAMAGIYVIPRLALQSTRDAVGRVKKFAGSIRNRKAINGHSVPMAGRAN